MELTSIGTVIARRVLELRGGGSVIVELGKPRRFRGGAADYYCPVRIRGLGEDYISYASGVDAFQALDLVFTYIGSQLYSSDEAKAGRHSWEGGTVKGDLGFPGFSRRTLSAIVARRPAAPARRRS
jgi:hypothetical protein